MARPSRPGCEITPTTEQMKDGTWSVVATADHQVGEGTQHTPLPVTHERFETEAAAHRFGLEQAQEYIAREEPAA